MRDLRKEYVVYGIWRVLPAVGAAVSRACEYGRRLRAATLPVRAAGTAGTRRPACPTGFRASVCGPAVANDHPLDTDGFDAADVARINAGSGIRASGNLAYLILIRSIDPGERGIAPHADGVAKHFGF